VILWRNALLQRTMVICRRIEGDKRQVTDNRRQIIWWNRSVRKNHLLISLPSWDPKCICVRFPVVALEQVGGPGLTLAAVTRQCVELQRGAWAALAVTLPWAVNTFKRNDSKCDSKWGYLTTQGMAIIHRRDYYPTFASDSILMIIPGHPHSAIPNESMMKST